MSLYTITLFLHLLAVVAAFSATALIHAGLVRMRKAEHVADARAGFMLAGRAGGVMPIVALALFLTGAYLTQTAWSWTTPWIEVSIGGLVVIAIVGGGVLGRRLRALQPLFQDAGDGAVEEALAGALRDPSLWIVAQLPPLLAIGVMFVMTTKPAVGVGIIEILAVVVIGVLATVPSSRASATGRVAVRE